MGYTYQAVYESPQSLVLFRGEVGEGVAEGSHSVAELGFTRMAVLLLHPYQY